MTLLFRSGGPSLDLLSHAAAFPVKPVGVLINPDAVLYGARPTGGAL